MTKFIILSFVWFASACLLMGCQRDQGVQAAYQQDNTGTYQPRPAPKGEVEQNQEMTGELQRIDMAAKTISIRVDNGMEQTFKFDENTMVMGLEGQSQSNVSPKKGNVTNAAVRNLVGKEGSEVTVQWRDQDGGKMATHVDVTQLSSRSHPAKRKARRAS